MRRLPQILYALFFVMAFSQIPVFIQEYEQRLGGAVDELARVIAADTDNARALDLDLNAFIQRHELSNDSAFRKSGVAMRERNQRHTVLDTSASMIANAPVWQKPFVVIERADPSILHRAWEKFHFTLTIDLWFGAVGLVAGLIFWDLLGWLGRALFGRKKPRRERPRRA